MEELKLEWVDLCREVSIGDTKIENWWKIILENYNSEKRYYHNLVHLQYFINQLKEIKNINISKRENIIFKFSIFFHDLIYDVSRKDNEEQSALMFKNKFIEETKPNMNVEDIERVVFFIQCTANHLSHQQVDDLLLFYFLDLDLSILGVSGQVDSSENNNFTSSKYFNYVKQIRKEYSNFNNEQFKQGRSNFLLKMLPTQSSTTQLFYTDEMKKKFEQQAIENMRKELEFYNTIDNWYEYLQ
ncbi:hypothetical protein ABK040_006412 [Willaertia magna]